MSKLGTEPAFPSILESRITPASSFYNEGISKRLWIATQLFPAFIQGYRVQKNFIELSVNLAYEATDELLKQENL